MWFKVTLDRDGSIKECIETALGAVSMSVCYIEAASREEACGYAKAWWEKRKLKRIAEGEKRRRLCAESGTCQNCGVKAHGPLCVECRARKTDRQRELRAGAERMRLPSSQTPEQRLSQAHRTEKKSRDAAGGTLGQHLRNVLAKFDENPEGFRAFLVSEINKRSDSKHQVK